MVLRSTSHARHPSSHGSVARARASRMPQRIMVPGDGGARDRKRCNSQNRRDLSGEILGTRQPKKFNVVRATDFLIGYVYEADAGGWRS